MGAAREHVRFNESDSHARLINKLNRLVDELHDKLAVAELRATQAISLDKSPTAGYALICDADGKGSWGEIADETEPGGSDTHVQFNDSGSFGGSSDLTWDGSVLTVTGSMGCTVTLACTGDCYVGTDLTVTGESTFNDEATFADDVVFSNTSNSILIGGNRTLFIKPTSSAPSSASDTGTQGELRIDGSYIFYCTATDTWKRAALTTW